MVHRRVWTAATVLLPVRSPVRMLSDVLFGFDSRKLAMLLQCCCLRRDMDVWYAKIFPEGCNEC